MTKFDQEVRSSLSRGAKKKQRPVFSTPAFFCARSAADRAGKSGGNSGEIHPEATPPSDTYIYGGTEAAVSARRPGESVIIDDPGAVDTENRGCTSESWTDRTFPDRETSTSAELTNGDYRPKLASHQKPAKGPLQPHTRRSETAREMDVRFGAIQGTAKVLDEDQRARAGSAVVYTAFHHVLGDHPLNDAHDLTHQCRALLRTHWYTRLNRMGFRFA